MSQARRLAGFSLVSMTALALWPCASRAQSLLSSGIASPLQILCLGDSETLGVGGTPGEGGFRSVLAQKLASANCQFQFVGRHADNSSLLPPSSQLNDGFKDYTIEPYDGKIGLYDAGKIDSPVSDVQIYHPDIILLLAGSENIDLGQNPADVVAQYDDLLKRILVMAPNAVVVVGAISRNSRHPNIDAAVTQFNTGLKNLIDELQNRNYKIHFVAGAALSRALLSDGTYPSQAGYDKIGEQIFVLLSKL